MRAVAANEPVAPFGEAPYTGEIEDHLREPYDANDLCSAADSNLNRDLDALLAQRSSMAPRAGSTPWDHTSAPTRLDLVDRRLRLRPDERAMLMRQGFVVPARFTFDTYSWALHEV